MKILEVISATGINGVSKHALDVGIGLRNLGHEVVFLGVHDSWILDSARHLRFDAMASDMHRWPDDELRRVAQIVRDREIDIVHTHMSKAHFFGVLLRWYSSVASVATAHNCRFQLHWMANDYVIAVSEATRRFHRRINWVANRRIQTIHNFIQVPSFDTRARDARRATIRAALGLSENDFAIGLVGRFAPQKGQLEMVEAMQHVAASVPAAQLFLIGGFERPEYVAQVQQRIDQHQLRDRVHLLGVRSDVLELLLGMDLLVQPSLWESFPISMLEGMGMGVPIVATDVGGVRECIDHNVSGYLVPPSRPAALSAAIVELHRDPSKRRRIAEEAARVVRLRFSPEPQIARIENVLQSVVQKRARHKAA
jgi:glycosyltransferase involved in cell wall biosynthesis